MKIAIFPLPMALRDHRHRQMRDYSLTNHRKIHRAMLGQEIP